MVAFTSCKSDKNQSKNTTNSATESLANTEGNVNFENSNQSDFSANALEDRLLEMSKEIQDMDTNSSDYIVKLNTIIDLFRSELLSHPNETFNYPFDRLMESSLVSIYKSSDDKVRIYNWDDRTGGSTSNTDGVYQIKTEDSVVTKAEPKIAVNGYLKDLYTLEKNKTYYITKIHSVYSTKDIGRSVSAFELNSNTLSPVKLFRTKNNAYYTISVDYDYFKAKEQFQDDAYDVIQVSDNAVNFRVVNPDEALTDNYLNYVWNGEFFKYDGVIK